MNVKRYMVAQCCGFGELEESPHGDFIHADDYNALANSGALVPVPVELSDWYMTPSGLGWWGEDKHGMPCVETPEGYHDAAHCYPVRLVPIAEWEAEE